MAERKNLRYRLEENGLTFVWLINMLRHKHICTDKSTMSSIVNGALSGPKADTILENSHVILDAYEQFVQSISWHDAH